MADTDGGDGPPERDVKDFSFKQMRKIRMFESPESLPTCRCSLIAVSSLYGLTLIGCPKGLKVIKTEVIEQIHDSDEGSMQNVVQQCPSTFIDLGHGVQFVGLSCDELTLSVCYEKENSVILLLFDVPTLGTANPSSARFGEICLGTDNGLSLINLLWNPGSSGLFAMCLSTGSVSIMEVTDVERKTLACLPVSVQATAICWSPKGKQLVVGHKDGRLTQYSQSLEVKKEIACPDLFDEPHSVTDLLWITPTFFAAVYTSVEEGDIPKFLLISTPKGEPVSISNLEDIHFVMSEERQPMFYLKFLNEWNLLISACSNGFEAAVVGQYGGEGPWEKWNFEETARAEMPLTYDNDETFPMGIALDFRSTKPQTQGEKQLPPAPIMMLLSTDGILCPFYMVNQTPNTRHDIMKTVQPLPQRGPRKTITLTAGHSTQKPSGPQGTSASGTLSFSTPKQEVPSRAPWTLSFSMPQQTLPASAFSFGTTGNAGTSSFSLSKQTVSTAVSTVPSGASGNLSAFSFPGNKTTVIPNLNTGSLGSSGGIGSFSFPSAVQPKPVSSSSCQTPAASSLTKTGVTQFSSNQVTSSQTQSGEASHPAQLVKPTPTVQTQPTVPKTQQSAQPQGFNLGASRPKSISAAPSQQQNDLVQPKPTAPSTSLVKPPSSERESAQSNKKSVVPSLDSSKAPSGKELSQGFRLPGASSTSAKAKVVQPSKEDKVEESLSKNIQELIKDFEKELSKLRENVNRMQENCRLTDDDRDLASFKKRTEQVRRTFKDIKDVTKEQRKDIEEEKGKLLECFEMLEDAKIRQERRNDPRYVQLLMSRPLDPVNANNMKEIRKYHLYLDKTLREVNLILDEQWNKENEVTRTIRRPALDDVYRTLKTNQKIAQNQAALLERIAGDMKSRKLLSNSWQGNLALSSASRDDELSILANSVVGPKASVTSPPYPNIPAPVSPQKQAQLRNILRNRRSTPVRRSKIAPSAFVTSPPLGSSRPEVPFLSSTPFVGKNGTKEGLDEDNAASDEAPSSQLTEPASNPVTKSATELGGPKGSFKIAGETLERTVESPPSDGSSGDGPQVERSSKEVEIISQGPKPNVQSPESAATATQVFKLSENTQTKAPEAEVHSQPLATGTSSASEVKPARSASESSAGGFKLPVEQKTTTATQAVPSKPSLTTSAFLPATGTQTSSTSQFATKTDAVMTVKPITTQTPPTVAAAVAAINRASVAKGTLLPSSNLDPSASIEPATLVAYRPPAQQGEQTKDYDSGTIAAKAIANAALMAATAEAQKPSTKPQSSTEFTFKSTDASKPGPPVVTFKPAVSPPRLSEGFPAVTAVPNVTVKPASVFKPMVLSPVTTATTSTTTTASGNPGLLFKGSPFSQTAAPGAPSGFGIASGFSFNFGAPSLQPGSASSAFSFGGKLADVSDSKTVSQISTTPTAVVSTIARNVTTPVPGDSTTSTKINRNLFDVSSMSLPAKPAVPSDPAGDKVEGGNQTVAHDQGDNKQSTGPQEPISGAIPTATSTAEATSLFTFGSSTQVNPSSGSILSQLMRASNSGASFSGSLFGAVSQPDAKAATSPTTNVRGQLPSTSVVAPSSTTASPVVIATTSTTNISAGTGGLFAPVPTVAGPVTSVSSLAEPPAGSVANAVPTPGVSLGSFFTQVNTTTPSSTSTAKSIFGSVATQPGQSFSAFSATNTGSGLFSGIKPVSATTALPSATTNVSTATAASPFAVSPLNGALTTPPKSSSGAAPVTTGLFGQAGTASAFGAVPSAVSAVGGGLFGAVAATTTTSGPLFGATVSTSSPFSTTPVFGSSGTATFGGAPTFGSPSNTQGNTFGTTPVFGSASSPSSTASIFGASSSTTKPIFGQSSFSPATTGSTTPFGQAATQSAETSLGFGFSGFGLGGQSSSQTNKNPFGAPPSFSSVSSDTSLFGGKTGADAFKPSFGSGSFSGFGTQSTGGFSSGAFSSKGGTVASSGFGMAPSSTVVGSSGFGAAPSFGSPTPSGSLFGGAPAFGTSPSFGGAPTFGSSQGGLGASPVGGGFGNVSPGGGFAQPSSGSPTFGMLASQSNLPTFGSFASTSQPTQGFGSTQQQGMSFGSFGSSGAQNVGGSSFQQWR